mmetsp:Transcript_32824/g.47894  ORF Transcript_32824/g.47894 Transcript_32824/m.47894 type:complete len:181 (+) Transcript_32824:166-708(+)
MSAYSALSNNSKTTQERYARGPFPAPEYDLPVVIPPCTHVQIQIDEIRKENNQYYHRTEWHAGRVEFATKDSYYVRYTDSFDKKIHSVYVKIIDACRVLRDEPLMLRDTRVAAERAANLLEEITRRNITVNQSTLPWFVRLGGKVRLRTDFSGLLSMPTSCLPIGVFHWPRLGCIDCTES